jgi:hypothetical protein
VKDRLLMYAQVLLRAGVINLKQDHVVGAIYHNSK